MAEPDLAAVAAGGQLQARERVDRDPVGLHAVDVAEGDVGPAASSWLQTRSHSPGGSSRVIGPQTANEIVFGWTAVISVMTGCGTGNHRGR